MRLIKIFLLVAGALAVSVVGARTAQACSALLKPIDQVIRESDTVVRARVVGPGVSLQVLEVLKGSYDRPFVSVTGQIRNYRSVPGAPASL